MITLYPVRDVRFHDDASEASMALVQKIIVAVRNIRQERGIPTATRLRVVLAVALPLAVTSSIMVLRQAPVYVATAEIEIKPPALDHWLTTLVGTETGRHDSSNQATFVANHEVNLRSRTLADDNVEFVILERRVELLFKNRLHPMDFVEKQHLPLANVGQNCRQVALDLQRRT